MKRKEVRYDTFNTKVRGERIKINITKTLEILTFLFPFKLSIRSQIGKTSKAKS
jgi:hypothetical protein